MTTVTGRDVAELYGAQGFDNAALTDHDDQVAVVEGVEAQHAGWPVLAYQVDLSGEYPEGLTSQQARAVADQINTQRAADLDPVGGLGD